MPSPAMQQLIDAFRDRRTARPGQAPPALEELRAGFAPAGRVHPLPDDVLVTAVTAGGVPAHWLDAPSPCWWPCVMPGRRCRQPPH